MIISFFKANRPTAVFALPFISLILWVLAIYKPVLSSAETGGPFFILLHELIDSWPIIGPLLTLFAVILGAFLVNRLATGEEILNSSTLVTGMCYVTLMSLTPNLTGFQAPAFSNVFLLLILIKLIRSYRKDTAYSEYFDIGTFLGIAVLFYVPSIVFMPLVWIGLLMFRPFVWREWVIGMIGFCIAFLIPCTLLFLFDRGDLLNPGTYMPEHFTVPALPAQAGNMIWFSLGVGVLVFLLSIWKMFGGAMYSVLRTRKNINILLWCSLFGSASVFLAPVFNASTLSFLMIPGSIFFSNYLLSTRRNGWTDLLFYLVCACSIGLHMVKIFQW